MRLIVYLSVVLPCKLMFFACKLFFAIVSKVIVGLFRLLRFVGRGVRKAFTKLRTSRHKTLAGKIGYPTSRYA